jgi:hypothetical protein
MILADHIRRQYLSQPSASRRTAAAQEGPRRVAAASPHGMQGYAPDVEWIRENVVRPCPGHCTDVFLRLPRNAPGRPPRLGALLPDRAIFCRARGARGRGRIRGKHDLTIGQHGFGHGGARTPILQSLIYPVQKPAKLRDPAHPTGKAVSIDLDRLPSKPHGSARQQSASTVRRGSARTCAFGARGSHGLDFSIPGQAGPRVSLVCFGASGPVDCCTCSRQ